MPAHKRTIILAVIFGLISLTATAGGQKLSDDEFQELSLRLSEDNGFFPTDNLVSNETSYLHVLPHIAKFVKNGEAYIGVGPEQNFSYIVQAKPSLAFIVDIRHDNLLHHLWLKSMLMTARNRSEYLSFLFSRPLPDGYKHSAKADARQLLRMIEDLAPDIDYSDRILNRLWQLLRKRYPKLINEGHRIIIETLVSEFRRNGPDIAYEIPGRSDLDFFPSWASLMEETDTIGRLGHYLSTESGFRFLKKMAEENRLVPVVGNLGGGKALKGVAEELRRRRLVVGILYLSNVEFYLFRNGTMPHFIDNVAALPINDGSILIRSYFNQLTGYSENHPLSVAGHLSVSLVQKLSAFLHQNQLEPYINYWDLATRDYIHLAPTPEP